VWKKLDEWAGRKVGAEPPKPMAENSTRKLAIKVGKKFAGSSKKEKNTKANNQFLTVYVFGFSIF
jgi:hypothetical protein